MLYYAYVLQSEKTGRKYYGSTEDMGVRLARHNDGKVKSSKAYRPYTIIYYEAFASRAEAYRRELFFKSVDGYKFLKEKGF